MERLGIGDLPDEVPASVFVAEGEQQPLAGGSVLDQATDVSAVVGDLFGVGDLVGSEWSGGVGDPDAAGRAQRRGGRGRRR